MHRRVRHLNPASAGAVASLDASTLTGNDGDAVAVWPGRPGTVVSPAGTILTQPTLRKTSFRGQQSVHFAITQFLEDLNGPDIPQPFIVISVASFDNIAGPAQYQIIFDRAVGGGGPFSYYGLNLNKYTLWAGNEVNSADLTASIEPQILNGLFNGASCTLNRNGSNNLISASAGTASLLGLYLGAAHNFQSSTYFVGDIGALIAISNKPRPLIKRLEQHLGFKFRIPIQ